MTNIIETLRDIASRGDWTNEDQSLLLSVADKLRNVEYVERRGYSAADARRDFARYMHVVALDYLNGRERTYVPNGRALVELDEGTDGATGRCRCSVCRKQIDLGDGFCRHCGAKLGGSK